MRAPDLRRLGRLLLPDVLLIVLFAGAICAPVLAWARYGIPEYRRMLEERMSAQLPAAPTNLVELSEYPQHCQDWFDDSLGLRAELLGLRSRVYFRLLDTSPTPAACFGTDAWVLLTGAREFDTHRGAVPFTEFELAAWASAIDARRHWCNARGIQYVFALVPFKTNVYPERHPLAWMEAIGPTRFDQLARRLAGDDAFLDLRPAVLRAKALDAPHDHAYFPLGSHWTDRGSTAGARELFERIRTLPGCGAWPAIADAEMIWDPAGCEGDSWAGRLYLEGVLEQNEHWLKGVRGEPPVDVTPPDAWHGLKITELADSKLPRVLFFHDSFGVSMEPFFRQRASHCVTMWRVFEPELVEREKPDLVVELFVEHVLDRPPIENLPEQAAIVEQRFLATRDVVFRLDTRRDEHEIGTRGGIDVERDDAGLHLHWTRADAAAQLPAALFPPATHVIVQLDLDAENAGEVSFFYLSPENDQYRRQQALTRAVVAGPNRLYLDLGQPGIRGPVIFRSPTLSSLVLRGCEARVVH